MNKITRILSIFVLIVGAAFASTQQLQNVTVDAPLVLTTTGPETGTIAAGATYTRTTYMATASNDDTYLVAVAQYPFQLANTTLDDFTKGFVGALGDNVKVLSSIDVTVSGLPAKSTAVELIKNGRAIRFFIVVTYRGNTGYIIAFGTWMDTQGTDPAVVKQYFQSISIQ